MKFLPTTKVEAEQYHKSYKNSYHSDENFYKENFFDIIFISGDPYYDHPLNGTALLARLLEQKGYRVGIIAQPQSDADFMKLGKPRLLFCISSGLLDSMLANYTPMLKKRENIHVPERAVIKYTQTIKRLFKDSITVIGGVEATIRRFTHFDYVENKLRKGILNDSKADFLLFGNAERSLLTLLEQLKLHFQKSVEQLKEIKAIKLIDGLSLRLKKEELPKDVRYLPSFEECAAETKKFNLLTRIQYLLPDDAFIEQTGFGYIFHNRPSHPLTETEMDVVYALPFARQLRPQSIDFYETNKMVENLQYSVILGRGCWGSCNFCIIPLVQGKNIARRSKEAIIKEIKQLSASGVRKINDLTMPTLNMYGSYCSLYNAAEEIYSPILERKITVYNKKQYCSQQCVGCEHRKLRDDLIPLLEEVEKLQKTIPIELELRSAIRHDIILSQKELFRKIMLFTKRLKIAPEHVQDSVLKNMNKANKKAFELFLREFKQINKEQGTNKRLVPYIVAAHPGCTMEDMQLLKEYCDKNKIFIELTQVFTPTPGTVSTAMYYTGENPNTREKVYVPRTFREKKDQKNMLFGIKTHNQDITEIDVKELVVNDENG